MDRAAEMIEIGQHARGGDLENCAIAVGTAVVSRAEVIAGITLDDSANRILAVGGGAAKLMQNRKRPRALTR